MMPALDNERLTLGMLLGLQGPAMDRPVLDITMDSREVRPGSLFIACSGIRSHGLDYVSDALAAGATAVVWESAPGISAPSVPTSVIAVEMPDLKRRVGDIADRFFGSPSAHVDVTGITGTNGKTTCAHLLASALEHLGKVAGYLGTLGVGRPTRLEPSSLTTENCVNVHRSLARMRESGAAHVAIEVSSHALDQDRVAGVRFRSAIFTNLSREHLDYHGSLAEYGRAKRRLLEYSGLRYRIINADDPFGRGLLASLREGAENVAVREETAAETSDAERFVAARRVVSGLDGLLVDFESSWGAGTLQSKLIGRFNAQNLLCVLAALLVSGVPYDDAIAALDAAPCVPGRMEPFRAPGKPLILVDFAHTPDALRKALQAAREICNGDLWCVFGCGGDRDRGKRPLMGAAAATLADRVLVTNDNPRSEDPQRIAQEILAGIHERDHVTTVLERAEAIAAAIAGAGADDVVVIAGKGHERYQDIGDRRRVFDDRQQVEDSMGSAR